MAIKFLMKINNNKKAVQFCFRGIRGQRIKAHQTYLQLILQKHGVSAVLELNKYVKEYETKNVQEG